MRSKTLPRFWTCFKKLPRNVQFQAVEAYHQFKVNPYHKSLYFKPVQGTKQSVYSARIGNHWRALGLVKGSIVYWFWIGPHSVYDKLVKQL